MLPTKYRFIWPSDFRGDDFLEIDQSVFENPVRPIVNDYQNTITDGLNLSQSCPCDDLKFSLTQMLKFILFKFCE